VILRAAKSAELISKISQIFLIYNDIDVEFQRDIFMSKANTKLNNFLTELDDKKNVWWQLAERKRSENSYESSTNTQNQYSYEYFRYDSYQFEYQRYRNDRIDSSRYSAYSESQRYDLIYDDNREYQSRDFLSTYSNYSNDSDKTNFNFTSLYSKTSSNQNDINRNQRSFLNTDQTSNDNDYQSRSDSLKNTSSKNDSSSALDQIRSNWTSRSTQFSSRSNEFDRRNDEYKSKIYNAEMKKQNLNQKYNQEDEYDEEFSQKKHNQKKMSINFVEYDDQRNELYYEEVAIESENKYETFAEFVEIEAFCIKCKTIFSFRNKLHKHLKTNCKAAKSIQFDQKKFVKSTKTLNAKTSAVTKSIIVKFTAFTLNKNYELTFRKWNYAETLIKLRLDFDEDFVCLNTRTEASLANRNFVLKRLSKAHIYLMTSSLIVRDIDANVHEIKEYVNFSIYLSSKNNSIKMIEIHREMHLMKNLKANMLINNDILESKEIIIDVQDKKTIIDSCQSVMSHIRI
jgi:hypothetical protein